MSLSVELPQRFWVNVDKEGPLWKGTPCWLWTGGQNGWGYGRLYWQGRSIGAHRLAYSMLVGPIPDNLDVDHLCRNRACVNPAHMDIVPRHVNAQRGARARYVGQPCASCGTHAGRVRGKEVAPTRIDGTRFGLAGPLCYRCYNRLYERQRRATAQGNTNG